MEEKEVSIDVSRLEHIKTEIDLLQKDIELLKDSGLEFLHRTPRLTSIRQRSNFLQETLEDLIQKQANDIEHIRDEFEHEKTRYVSAMNQLETKLEEQKQKLIEISI